MSDPRWLDILAGIGPGTPVDLDEAWGAPVPALDAPAAGAPAVSPKLWSRDPARSYIGIRVATAPADPARIALRLAAAAAERGVIPVFLSSLPTTGFEPFGLRVERLPDGPAEARAACEAELMAFWDMPIVIDLEDAERLV